jgi:hypothetical protein
MSCTSHSIELDRLYKELEEVKNEIEYFYLQGHNDEVLNSKYHRLLSEINGTKLSKF